MPALRLISRKEDLDSGRLQGQVVVVVDVLFATSAIVAAFDRGIARIWPALDASEARRLSASLGGCVCAGEYLGEQLPGFAASTPLLLSSECRLGAALVYSTTNGTVALRQASAASFVYVGALLNGASLVDYIVRAHAGMPVLLVCAGSAGHFNLEDFYAAGHLAAHFARHAQYEFSDAALAAMLLRLGAETYPTLLASKVGRMMQDRFLENEVMFASRPDTMHVIVRLRGECLERVDQ